MNSTAPADQKKKRDDLKMLRVFRIVRTDVLEADDIEQNTYNITFVDGQHQNKVLPCSREVFLAGESLGRLTNHYIDLYQDKSGTVVATDGYERNDFMQRMTPSEEGAQDIVVTIDPVTRLSSVRARPYSVSANDVTAIKRLVDAVDDPKPFMILGNKYEIREVVDSGPNSPKRLVITPPKG